MKAISLANLKWTELNRIERENSIERKRILIIFIRITGRQRGGKLLHDIVISFRGRTYKLRYNQCTAAIMIIYA